MSRIDTAEISTINEILAEKSYNTNDDIVDIEQTLVKLVVFTLDQNWYAFPSANIKELLSDNCVSPLPSCPATLEGVINVRGDIESVISLRALFRLEKLKDISQSKILLAATDSMRSGIRVDSVEELLDFPEDNIKPAPANLPAHMAPIVTGVVELKDQSVAILDIEKMFADYRDGLQG